MSGVRLKKLRRPRRRIDRGARPPDIYCRPISQIVDPAWRKRPCFASERVAHRLLGWPAAEAKYLASAQDEWHSEPVPIMNVRLATLALSVAVLWGSPAFADARSDAQAQVAFGISVAQRGLWREAIYRWEKAVELDPTYAAAFNDLAIGYEHEGQLDKARRAYEKAVQLAPNSNEIRQNFELFKEINDRTSGAKEKQ
jgi:tetratricopeptide (TPR) repeat protein